MFALLWFLLTTYVWYRGVCLVFLETLENCWALMGPDRRAPMVSVTFKMHSINSVFKYFYRLLHMSKKRSFPLVVIEGTYAPKRSFQNAGIFIRGDICEHHRKNILTIVEKYPSIHKAYPHGSWLKVIAFKAHIVYQSVFYQLYKLCQEQGGFFLGTVTNDPFADPHLTCIGFDDFVFLETKKITKTIPQITVVSF